MVSRCSVTFTDKHHPRTTLHEPTGAGHIEAIY